MSITVIIPVRNEQVNIVECLQSVRWADHVFVVDSHSSDQTAKLAEAHGATVVQFDYDGGWPKKKNWALRNLPIQSDWTMIVDADEQVSEALRDEILEVTSRGGLHNGYYVRWKFVFLGRWMKHSWSHGWMLRVFRTGEAEYEDLGMRGEGGWDNEVHENLILRNGSAGLLKNPLLHESKQDLSYWIRKQNEFSDWNAEARQRLLRETIPPLRDAFSRDPLLRRRWKKAVFVRMPFKPLLLFLYLYLAKGGFLDGRAGLYFCRLRAMHELNVCAKVYERTRRQ